MSAYYNEHDGFKAEWLRELIRGGHIAQGEVDERSIADVGLDDVRGFTQAHFFAGIGVWSYALRLAGWPDDRPVWTGSCPCPGFSAAGKGGGFADPRHLWPDWFRLIRECRPANIFGEQADDAVGFGWLDLVQTDLEAADYAVGKAVFGACSVGAPHIRQRLYFGAESLRTASERGAGSISRTEAPVSSARLENGHISDGPTNGGDADRGAHAAESRRPNAREHNGRPSQLPARSAERDGASERAHAEQPRLEGHAGHGDGSDQPGRQHAHATRPTGAAGSHDERSDAARGGLGEHRSASRHAGHADHPGALNGFWSDAIWLPCSDGKYRPTQPGLFPLAHGAAARVGRLRGYGDAIVAQQAQAFIEAWMT